MNSYPKPLFHMQSGTPVLWGALLFFILAGVYSTFLQLTYAGHSVTSKLPIQQISSDSVETQPSVAAHNKSTTVATITAATTLPPYNTFPSNALELGHKINAAWFGEAHWPALQKLWTKESNWNPNARNRSSGACGIPQALPCSKITDMTPKGQIEWGLSYIERRYKTPTNAWRHFQSRGWY